MSSRRVITTYNYSNAELEKGITNETATEEFSNNPDKQKSTEKSNPKRTDTIIDCNIFSIKTSSKISSITEATK